MWLISKTDFPGACSNLDNQSIVDSEAGCTSNFFGSICLGSSGNGMVSYANQIAMYSDVLATSPGQDDVVNVMHKSCKDSCTALRQTR